MPIRYVSDMTTERTSAFRDLLRKMGTDKSIIIDLCHFPKWHSISLMETESFESRLRCSFVSIPVLLYYTMEKIRSPFLFFFFFIAIEYC